MRISSQQIFNNGVSNMQKGQAALAKTQEQVSTGKNLSRPSDDPIAAAQILKYRRELAATDNYQQNISVSQRRLDQEELVLQQVKDAGDRLKELALRGNNGTMTTQDRAGIAAEAEQVQQFILGLMNSQDAQGEYLFSGSRGDIQPFDANVGFDYKGDSEVRFIQTGSGSRVQSTSNGRDLFQVVPGDIEMTLLNKPVGVEVSLLPATEVGGKTPFQSYIEENGRQDLTLSVTAAIPAGNPLAVPAEPAVPASYQLVDGTGTVLLTDTFDPLIDPASKWQLDDPTTGLTLNITATVEAAWTASPGTTTNTLIRPVQENQSILDIAQKLIDRLKAPIAGETGQAQFSSDMAEVLSEVDLAQESVVTAHSQLGGRMVMLEQQQTINEELSIFTQTALSSLEDLDYASAIAKFSFQEVALQAAQQTFARVNQLSLFNYL